MTLLERLERAGHRPILRSGQPAPLPADRDRPTPDPKPEPIVARLARTGTLPSKVWPS
jgi:hypothetical protein